MTYGCAGSKIIVMNEVTNLNKPATKQDMLTLKAELQACSTQDMRTLKSELQTSTKQDMQALKTELQASSKQDMLKLKAEIQTTTRQEMQAMKTELQTTTKQDMHNLKAELQAANKHDLNALEGRIAKLFSDGLQLIADQFDKQNKILATKADKSDVARLERKLTATSLKTNQTSKTLQKLKRAVA